MSCKGHPGSTKCQIAQECPMVTKFKLWNKSLTSSYGSVFQVWKTWSGTSIKIEVKNAVNIFVAMYVGLLERNTLSLWCRNCEGNPLQYFKIGSMCLRKNADDIWTSPFFWRIGTDGIQHSVRVTLFQVSTDPNRHFSWRNILTIDVNWQFITVFAIKTTQRYAHVAYTIRYAVHAWYFCDHAWKHSALWICVQVHTDWIDSLQAEQIRNDGLYFTDSNPVLTVPKMCLIWLVMWKAFLLINSMFTLIASIIDSK